MALLQRLLAITTKGSKTLKSKNACCSRFQKPRVLIFTFASFELFDVLPDSSSPDNVVNFGSILVSLHTSDIIFAVRSQKLLFILSCNSYCAEYQVYYHQDKMLVDCMFSQQYRSPIKSENCCLDNLNPNSVIGRTVNQFETPVRADISTKRFSLTFISVLNLLMMFLYFSSLASWSQFWVPSDYLRLYSTANFLNWCSKFWCAFAGVNKLNCRCLMKY